MLKSRVKFVRNPGICGKHGEDSQLKINSLRLIKTAKPSVCLSSLVSLTVGDYPALDLGGILDCQKAVREQPAGLVKASWVKKHFYHCGADELCRERREPLAGKLTESSLSCISMSELN
ncbi:hypothetical protein PAMP_019407 [Pampus punctatissimus]